MTPQPARTALAAATASTGQRFPAWRGISPYHQCPVLAELLDTDQIIGFPPVRERHRAERHHSRPLIEHPVEAAEDIACRPARLTSRYTWHFPHVLTTTQCREPAGW
jgi:hypothetical protein